MNIVLLAFILVFGLCVGSFINALEYRIGTKLSIVKGRSICPNCKKQLAWYDNVPVFSFVFLRGRCRQCHKPISWQYPVVELLTGFAFVAAVMKAFKIPASAGMTVGRVGMTVGGVGITIEEFIVRAQSRTILELILLFTIFSILILVALHDQKTTYVLSGYVYAAMALTLIYLIAKYAGVWNARELVTYLLPNVLSSLAAMAPFALLYVISKGAWMGAGDIEIAALLGLLLGWPNLLVALYFAFFVGSIWGLAKVYLLKNAKLKSEMPFAPFLIAGIGFAFLFSEQIVSLYVRIFLGA